MVSQTCVAAPKTGCGVPGLALQQFYEDLLEQSTTLPARSVKCVRCRRGLLQQRACGVGRARSTTTKHYRRMYSDDDRGQQSVGRLHSDMGVAAGGADQGGPVCVSVGGEGGRVCECGRGRSPHRGPHVATVATKSCCYHTPPHTHLSWLCQHSTRLLRPCTSARPPCPCPRAESWSDHCRKTTQNVSDTFKYIILITYKLILDLKSHRHLRAGDPRISPQVISSLLSQKCSQQLESPKHLHRLTLG